MSNNMKKKDKKSIMNTVKKGLKSMRNASSNKTNKSKQTPRIKNKHIVTPIPTNEHYLLEDNDSNSSSTRKSSFIPSFSYKPKSPSSSQKSNLSPFFGASDSHSAISRNKNINKNTESQRLIHRKNDSIVKGLSSTKKSTQKLKSSNRRKHRLPFNRPSLFINKRADNILTSSNEFNHLLYDRNGMHMNKVIILNKHIIIIEGAAGAMHGAAVSGALATTFTASQCLLLMITNLYQFSGELLPGVFHVAARAITKQALSIFGDHQDVMACRQSGVAMLCSNNPQEAQDLAIVAHIATLKSRVPFIHFQDGWRTTSVVHTIKLFTDEQIKALYPYDALETNLRNIGININDANMRGTAQGPDVYFQSLVANNKYYVVSADIVQQTMDDFARVTGREYKLFQYYGSPNAEKVIVMMGSACDTTEVLNKLLMI
eukprot:514210_1